MRGCMVGLGRRLNSLNPYTIQRQFLSSGREIRGCESREVGIEGALTKTTIIEAIISSHALYMTHYSCGFEGIDKDHDGHAIGWEIPI